MVVERDATRNRRRRAGARFRLALTSVALLTAGCAVGPNFVRPAPPDVRAYTTEPLPAELSAGVDEPSQITTGSDAVASDWWQVFGSPAIEDVVRQALAANRSLAAARSTLAAADETVQQARGGYYPQLDVGASAEARRRSSDHGGDTYHVSDTYALGPTLSFTPDIFGANRRFVEQKQALAANECFQVAASYLGITGNAVTQAITTASLRAEIAAVESVVADDEHNLTLVRERQDAGKAALVDVVAAEEQLAADQAQLPPLRQALNVTSDALAVLVARFAGEWSPPAFELTALTLPHELPLSVPSALVRQRPDILAAEAQLHADSAAIGVATAEMYPKLTLTGAAAFDTSSVVWDVASELTAPVFRGGSLRAQKRAAVDTYDASLARYQQTVLAAFGQVADTLHALVNDADLVATRRRSLDASRKSLSLQRESYAYGKSDLIRLLDAERVYEEALVGYVSAVSQRYADTAALYVVMGRGWWERPGDESRAIGDCLDDSQSGGLSKTL
jgi:NodT family efflux transporter outer membrane factor (OMF) lipoprotein